jgi:DNA-binding transcriptional regulator GbsR (MarR family)
MNMNTISISEIQRNLHKLNDFDIVEVVDKKRHQVKGYFLDKKYHDFVEELFQAKENRNANKLKALEAMGSYALGGSDIEDVKASMYDD